MQFYKAPLDLSKQDGCKRNKPVKFEPGAGIGQKGAFFKGLQDAVGMD
jgi:hypothetical protein